MTIKTPTESKYKILQDTFGFAEFRPLQEKVIDKILSHEDILLILPTGGGKSLCYQLPGMLMEGVVVVISPLLALMQDQVQGLVSKGVSALMMSSLQDAKTNIQAEHEIKNARVKFVFVAPERLQSNYFIQFLKAVPIAFFAIDEAHCVSEWGHEFRSDYRQLGLLKNHFPKIGVAAFTATATPQVEKDIVSQLQFADAKNIVRGNVFRDNLFINVEARQGNGHQQLLTFLQNHQDEQGIIYTLSRKNTEALSKFLCTQGLRAHAYHAGLPADERKKAFNAFVNDDIDIMVATIAFGMGIDKSNIRFVVHMSIPKTMEAYYQEMGRAGRDGLASEVLLLYAMADLSLLGRFIEAIDNEAYRNLAYQKLNVMRQYVFLEGCRHRALSQYFDDAMLACDTQCDNCLNPDTQRSDISEKAQMFLSTVYRTKQCFGQAHIIDVLLGSKNQKVLHNKHDELSVYGIGAADNKFLWRMIADRLLELEAITLGEFKVLKLTHLARKILKSEAKVDIRSSSLQARKKQSYKKEAQYQVDENVFDALKALRREIAKQENMPAYIIFDNKTLVEMAHFMPDTKEKLLNINGVGQVKIEKYGSQFLSVLRQLKSRES